MDQNQQRLGHAQNHDYTYDHDEQAYINFDYADQLQHVIVPDLEVSF
jgi:hypothetical protein